MRKKPAYEGMKPLGKQYACMKSRLASGFHAPEAFEVGSSEGVNEVHYSNTLPESAFSFVCRQRLHGMTCRKIPFHRHLHLMPFRRLIHPSAITTRSPAKVDPFSSASQNGGVCHAGHSHPLLPPASTR